MTIVATKTMAAKHDIDQAKAILDGRVARIREKARKIAYRVRAFLAIDQQRLLDEVVRSDDPRMILARTFFLLKEHSSTIVELGFYLEILPPWIAQSMGLLLKIGVEWDRLDRAEHMYEIAKRKCAAGSPAGEHEASTRSEILPQHLTPNASGSEVGKSSKGPGA
jgi:hypothetical protein